MSNNKTHTLEKKEVTVMSFQFPDDLFAPGTTDVRERIQAFMKELGEKQSQYVAEVSEYNKIAADFKTITKKMTFTDIQARADLLTTPNVLLEYENAVIKGITIGIGAIGTVTTAISLASRVAVLLKTKGVITAVKSIQKVQKFAKVGKITGALSVIFGIADLVLTIVSAQDQKKKLDAEKDHILQILNEVEGIIAQVNASTKDVVNALLTIFKEQNVKFDGIFNQNLDGIVDEAKYRNAINVTQNQLNGLIASLGANAEKKRTASRSIFRKLQRRKDNNQPLELSQQELDDIAFDSGLDLDPDSVKVIYAEQLLKIDLSVEEAANKSGRSIGDVKDLYAIQLLKIGKTVEQSSQLSGVSIERVQEFQYQLDKLARINLEQGQEADKIAQDFELPVELIQKVKEALLRLEQGQTVEQVAHDLELSVERVKRLKEVQN